MSYQSRFPQLAYPFALVGAAAGWLSAGFLANPIVDVMARREQALAALCACGVTAGVGALLTWVSRRLAPHDDAWAPWALLIVALLAAGATSGGAVGAIGPGTGGAVVSGGINGALSAVAFLPVAALVLAAARRAQRARRGSIVAGADRRAIWGILTTALAVMTLAALPDWPASTARLPIGDAGIVPAPTVALGLVLASGILLLVLTIADAIAVWRVRRAAADAVAPRGDAEEIDARAEGISHVDLGLGDETFARLAQRGPVYRSHERALALVQGDPAEARAALYGAVARGVLGIAVVTAVIAAHSAATGPEVTSAYMERLPKKAN